MKRAKTVEDYIAAAGSWSAELEQLRNILRSTGLEEAVKWGAPCYVLDGKNVVGIGAFKSYAFKKMRPGLRREYANYIAEAKRDTTRQRRLQKILPMIRQGIGLNDKYR